MNLSFNRVELHLQAYQVIRLHDPEGARAECLSGTLWITQNGDHRDHLLQSDGVLTLDRPGLALIRAQEPSELALFEPVLLPGFWHRIGRMLSAASNAMGRWLVRTFGPESIDFPRSRGWHRLL
jgi:hypothetical protein